MRICLSKAAVPPLVAIVLALLPTPAGLTDSAWRFLAVFAGTVTALILEPIPAAATGLIAVSLAAALRLVEASPAESARWALSGFGNTTVWLIFAAFVFALGYEKSGLGRRIALLLIRGLGRRPLGLGYAVAASDLLLAPFTPSNTARSAGTIFPVIRHIPALVAQRSPNEAARLGGYLMWTAFASTCVTSSMFLTGLAPNLLALEMVRKTVSVQLDWTTWLAGIWPVGLGLLAFVPLASYAAFQPAAVASDDVTEWAASELRAMGPFSRGEASMCALALLALAGWVFGRTLLDATTVALVVVAIMVVTRLVSWDDVVGHRAAWNVLVWFATLVALADGLSRVGFVSWIVRGATARLAGLPPVQTAMGLIALFFVVHYLFASITAHVTAVLPVALAASTAIAGIDAGRVALLLCYALGLMGVISPYATGPAPVYYGSGHISRRQFWTLGFAFGAAYLGALLGLALYHL
jgi:L-tartrate/succinate antiporter